jgi:hypothetical protein
MGGVTLPHHDSANRQLRSHVGLCEPYAVERTHGWVNQYGKAGLVHRTPPEGGRVLAGMANAPIVYGRLVRRAWTCYR